LNKDRPHDALLILAKQNYLYFDIEFILDKCHGLFVTVALQVSAIPARMISPIQYTACGTLRTETPSGSRNAAEAEINQNLPFTGNLPPIRPSELCI
jgi:hypothetical protein